MANITTCSNCSHLFEASSEEEANLPDRLCLTCFDRASNHPVECRCDLCQKWWKRVPEEE